ncbi:Nitroreductase [Mytilinidion resinicola]|uniref:Nitroreductase n=1 Tax=Mytilinidion resinicola TaxID=574789 RepID=A0A6A6YIZ5_9PEZI|nr:Nitroreductase [Mytilinidion resinicola]KAF2808493.1 Nitroreductase [Mytilinidion resinicola]
MAYQTSFLAATKARRSIYTLTKDSPIPASRIENIIGHAIQYAPSPFNVRSTRVVILFGDSHTKLWEFGLKHVEENTPHALGFLAPKIKGFSDAYGTCLFFDDSSSVDELSPRFAALSKQYPEWAEHSMGMHQFVAWTALEAEGLGCNLQHYNPGVNAAVAKEWNIPETWQLKAQLVFGGIKADAPPLEDKPKRPLEECVKVFGA